ncbi:MAG: hypothetical protein EXR71_17825 [Myxococcales bacterium]|nr:hypothetical protein [Myxococcales bacterium]
MLAALFLVPALAATPVEVRVSGAGIPSSESILVSLTEDDGDVVNIAARDNGRLPDIRAADGTWTGRGEMKGDRAALGLSAGRRTFGSGAVSWAEQGARRVRIVVKGNQTQIASTLIDADDEPAPRTRWVGSPWLAVFAALVGAIGLFEWWGPGRSAGRQRLPVPQLIPGGGRARGLVHVAEPAEAATKLVGRLAEVYTVFVAGRFSVPECAPGRVVRLVPENPDRVAAILSARPLEERAVVIVAAANDAQDWASLADELPSDVPLFVLVSAGADAPELLVDGEIRWR